MPVRSETWLTDAGLNVVVLTTAIRGRGIWVESTYLGHVGAETQVAHLTAAPGRQGETESRSVPHELIPVIHVRRRCLYDHLQELQDFLVELGHTAQIDGLEAAVAAMELAADA
jgi:hypothetical protein